MDKVLVMQSLEKVVYGFKCLNESLSNVSNKEENEILERAINGDTAEGYAQDIYPFTYSFDEETWCLDRYLDLFIEQKLGLTREYSEGKDYYYSLYPNHTFDSLIVMAMYGLKCMVEGIEEIYNLTKDDTELTELLKEKVCDTDCEYESIFRFGVYTLLRKVKGFRRAYLKEVKELLGRYAFDKHKAEYQKLI